MDNTDVFRTDETRYTKELLDLAVKIAYTAHHGQTDRQGVEYIRHPLVVMQKLDTNKKKILGVLHDVAEDTIFTVDDLTLIFGEEIGRILDLLTRRKDENYFDYINRVKTDPEAVEVKLADLEHNSDRSRVVKPDDKMLSLWERYDKAIAILKNNA